MSRTVSTIDYKALAKRLRKLQAGEAYEAADLIERMAQEKPAMWAQSNHVSWASTQGIDRRISRAAREARRRMIAARNAAGSSSEIVAHAGERPALSTNRGNAMTMTLADHERRKADVRDQIAAEKKRHAEAMGALQHEYMEAEEQVHLLCNGLDTSVTLLAEHVLAIHGTFSQAGAERVGVIEDAIADLLTGAKKLRHEYFGTKDYAHWHGQREDHRYGYGPRHGYTIFSVGLSRPLLESGRDLTEDEVSAAIYYLRNLERIQRASADAASAAASATSEVPA